MLSQLQRAYKTLGGLALIIGLPAVALGQVTNYYAPQAGQYKPAGSLAGDQNNSSVAISTNAGFIVWQDNNTDGDGLGISAIQLDATLSAPFGSFRVNTIVAGDQENPQVALLKNGGAVFVWQGGPQGQQHIFARFMTQNGTTFSFGTNADVMVNTATNFQFEPVVAPLNNGNVVVAYTRKGQNQADGQQSIYAQILTPAGQKVGSEFVVNQFSPGNQHSPSVAAFANGNFIVAYVSERQTSTQGANSSGVAGNGYDSVDIFARVFDSNGGNVVNEFRVNTSTNACANPNVAVGADGGYLIGWTETFPISTLYSSDVLGRNFNSANNPINTPYLINSQRYDYQYQAKISAAGNDYMVVWTSENQDGSGKGVYSQFIRNDGVLEGGESLVNTTIVSDQYQPAVASDGRSRFLVVWSSFANLTYSVDLYGQRYNTLLQPLSAPSAPVTLALDTYYYSVTWAPVQGFSLANYILYVDGVTNLLATNLYDTYLDGGYSFGPNSAHTFQLAYALTDGRVSPLSTITTNKTLGPDANHDGLADSWQSMYFGTNKANWPGANTYLAPGVQAIQVFSWGANPTNSATWLKQSITHDSQGWRLNWNTVPGGIYQVLNSAGPNGPFSALGTPRYAYGSTDSTYLGLSVQGYFRIQKLY